MEINSESKLQNIRYTKTINDPENETYFLRQFVETFPDNRYIIYYLDSSNNKHGEEKHYTDDVGLYPGGYGWPDLDYIHTYNHGQLLSISHHINNYKSTPDMLYIYEYNPDTNESSAIYYEYRYEYDSNDNYVPVTKGWLEYYWKGDLSGLIYNGCIHDIKETFTGIVYEWNRNPVGGDVLSAIHLYENGSSIKKHKEYYKNGFLMKEDGRTYNYTGMCEKGTYTLKWPLEEYCIDPIDPIDAIDAKKTTTNNKRIYYKFENGQLIEKTEYDCDNKHGESIIYNLEAETKNNYNKYKYIKMKMTFLNGKEYTRTIMTPRKEYMYNDKENTSAISEFYSSHHYEHSQKMKYSVSGHYLNEENIKVGSYMEWYPSGSLFLMMHYLDGKLDGPVCSFYENGQPNVKGIYKNGEKIGIFSYTMMSQNKPTTRYFNHDTNQHINAIDIGEPFRGLSELDSWIGFPYNSF